MRRLTPLVLLLLGCQRHDCPRAAEVNATQLFVFAGQSNMTGFPPYGVQVSGDPKLIYLNDPQNGPAVSFLRAYRALHPDQTVAALNYAIGGTSVACWNPQSSDGGCYAGMRAGVKAKLAADPGMSPAGFVFYQGECDASQLCVNRTADWKDAFLNVIQDVRSDFGSPYLPVVFAQLGTHDDSLYPAQYWDDIRQQQAAVYAVDVAMVKTDDLARRDDVHLTDASYAELGPRMEGAYESIAYPGCEEYTTIAGVRVN